MARVGLNPPTQLGNSRDGDVLISSSWLRAWHLQPGGQQSFVLVCAEGTSLLRACRILPGTSGLVSLFLFLLLVQAAKPFLPSSPGAVSASSALGAPAFLQRLFTILF